MTNTTVADFAAELNKSPEALLSQLNSAGVTKTSASDSLTEADSACCWITCVAALVASARRSC